VREMAITAGGLLISPGRKKWPGPRRELIDRGNYFSDGGWRNKDRKTAYGNNVPLRFLQGKGRKTKRNHMSSMRGSWKGYSKSTGGCLCLL